MYETIKVTINIDEVVDGNGIPVPPKNTTELEKRKYKADWVKTPPQFVSTLRKVTVCCG